MSYRSVKQILNAVFDSDDTILRGISKTEGEVLNMVLDETGDPALKVRVEGLPDGTGLTDEEKAELARASKNYLINPFDSQFVVNQRGYVSGATLASGAYGYDRWKAYGGAAAITFSGGYYYLTSGTIEQIIEVSDITGETLTLSADTGGTTVNCTVDGQTGTLPMTVTITNSGNISVRLSGGKVRNVKLGYNEIYIPVERADCETACRRTLKVIPPVRIPSGVVVSTLLEFSLEHTLRDGVTQILAAGVESTDWQVLSESGSVQTGFTLSLFSSSNGGAKVRATKTSHGLTSGILSIISNKNYIKAEL